MASTTGFVIRVMVPIHDPEVEVIGFGGRSLDGSEPEISEFS